MPPLSRRQPQDVGLQYGCTPLHLVERALTRRTRAAARGRPRGPPVDGSWTHDTELVFDMEARGGPLLGRRPDPLGPTPPACSLRDALRPAAASDGPGIGLPGPLVGPHARSAATGDRSEAGRRSVRRRPPVVVVSEPSTPATKAGRCVDARSAARYERCQTLRSSPHWYPTGTDVRGDAARSSCHDGSAFRGAQKRVCPCTQ